MSFLTPLYIAGGLAIALPILFHLIRRTPHGQQPFSSLMFLTPSPPRLTRRSRLNNILLLLLRAAALALLALAFARPFFRQDADLDVSQSRGRRIGILVDTSASMQRGDLWRQANQQVEQVLKDVAPADEVGLYFFDREVRPAMTFAEWSELDLSRRAAMLRARLAEAAPSWSHTNIGHALATVADALAEAEGSQRATEAATRQLVLISDMQQGGHVEALQGHQWPQNVLLDIKPVSLKDATNASVQAVEDSVDAATETGGAATGDRLRVRVANQPDSNREQFLLRWANEQGPLPQTEPVKLYVPPGRSQVGRVPWPPADVRADRLVLEGDACEFDNTLFIVRPRRDTVRVAFLGDDGPDDARGLQYYLRSAAADTPRRQVEFITRRADEGLTDADLLGTRLLVIATPLPDDKVPSLRRFIEGGGDVLWVLKDTAAARGLSALSGAALDVAEATVRDFALLGRVNTEHPLFAPFADVRFADFTKIHFWKHRRLKTNDPASRTLASFDNGDPFLVEKPIGKGRLLIATSGWHPADSQLALSTKFVPLIDGLLRRRDGAAFEAQYAVHATIALPPPPTTKPAATATAVRALIGPDGRKIELADSATSFAGADRPGIYRLIQNGEETPIAVNLGADESRTAPVGPDDFAQLGAKMGANAPPEELETRKRQLQIVELENRQKVWRWVILAVLGLLAAETALAGRLARRPAAGDAADAEPQQVTT